MNKPHKHAEVIKAWADGAEIEWRENEHGDWRVDYSKIPAFDHTYYEFRIKPIVKLPEGFISFADGHTIPYRPDLKGYEFLLSDGTIEFLKSGHGIPYCATIVAYRPVPNKVVRWQWIIQWDGQKPSMTSQFLTESEAQCTMLDACCILMQKAEWTWTEFDA